MMATPFVPVASSGPAPKDAPQDGKKDVVADAKVVEKPKGFRAALRDAKEQAGSTPRGGKSGNPANRQSSGSGRVTPPKPVPKSKQKATPPKADPVAKSKKGEPPAGDATDESKAKRKRRR